jgi:hypothetical protein
MNNEYQFREVVRVESGAIEASCFGDARDLYFDKFEKINFKGLYTDSVEFYETDNGNGTYSFEEVIIIEMIGVSAPDLETAREVYYDAFKAINFQGFEVQTESFTMQKKNKEGLFIDEYDQP